MIMNDLPGTCNCDIPTPHVKAAPSYGVVPSTICWAGRSRGLGPEALPAHQGGELDSSSQAGPTGETQCRD